MESCSSRIGSLLGCFVRLNSVFGMSVFFTAMDRMDHCAAVCKVTRVCDTGYPSQVCPVSRFSLLLTCGGCIEIENGSFVLFARMED